MTLAQGRDDMAYIDDWSGVSPDEQKFLEHSCQRCSHMRYVHGDTLEGRSMGFRVIAHTPGRCGACSCQEFAADLPLTGDDVLDAADGLTGDVRLSDWGIVGPV